MLAAFVAALSSLAVNSNKSEGNHSWAYRGQRLQALKPDLIATLNG